MTEIPITTGAEAEWRSAAERSKAYGALARAFRLPDRAIHEEIVSGRLAAALQRDDPALRLRPDLSFEALQAEYLRLFEVGTPRPPCPLYEGAWREREFADRRDLMEELVRFYHYFGLTLGPKPKELPDHLAIELEFLHFLTYQEARALEAGRDPGGLRRARRDFLKRHGLVWLPRLCEKLKDPSLKADPFYIMLTDAAVQVMRHDAKGLKAHLG